MTARLGSNGAVFHQLPWANWSILLTHLPRHACTFQCLASVLLLPAIRRFFFQIFVINVVRYSRERPWSQASFLPANPITDYQSIMDHGPLIFSTFIGDQFLKSDDLNV